MKEYWNYGFYWKAWLQINNNKRKHMRVAFHWINKTNTINISKYVTKGLKYKKSNLLLLSIFQNNYITILVCYFFNVITSKNCKTLAVICCHFPIKK